ncbi:MAG: mechanosensitive ion channel family protein [Candidatus Palauibacterales bacterium]|nr:mechanosensitive ion channel family protein [Candidatus Palauibacterales bacterium]
MPLDTQQLLQLGIPLAVAFLGLLVGFVVRRTLLARLARAAKDTRSTVDDVIVSAVHGPVVVWFFVAGLYAAVHVTRLSPRVVGLIQIVLVVLVILSVSWTLASIAGAALQALAERADIPSATLVNNLARITVLGVGGLMVLNSLGISITPIITALGVGGLAVALALQDTLANLFAGIHILATRKIRPGDYVKLASGEEGYVVDVTWRQTTIRQLPHNIITVPNSEIASTSTTNYNLPHKELSVYVQVGVAYDSDLEHVERVTLEVAKEVMNEVEGWSDRVRAARQVPHVRGFEHQFHADHARQGIRQPVSSQARVYQAPAQAVRRGEDRDPVPDSHDPDASRERAVAVA